jgi:hypothetical protein
MLTNSKIALSLALVLATASAAVAAPKHAVRHQTATLRPAEGAGAYGDACHRPPPNRPIHGTTLETRPGCTFRRIWPGRYDVGLSGHGS